MLRKYPGVITRFLNNDERLMLSKAGELPLVIDANNQTSTRFLQTFLQTHSSDILADVANYGAVLFRGFAIASDDDFEKTIIAIDGFNGISEAFMSEEGRIHVDNLNYILHTNAVYKTGGTLYLGGFHSENYYTPDVPAYIAFCCLTPSEQGGETGLIDMEKIYNHLDDALKQKLEEKTFFVSKWLLSEVAERYQLPIAKIEAICQQFDLPIIDHDKETFVLLYKPSIFNHPITHKKSLQINLFEIPTLNAEMRQCFMADYPGKTWFWHRLVWRLPASILKLLEYSYMIGASLVYSPKNALNNLRLKLMTCKATYKKHNRAVFDDTKVGSCFNDKDVKNLATLIRAYYSSCIWQKGDILLIDNRKVMHAGMPGKGARLIRAIIGNPLDIKYSSNQSGLINCQERYNETVGFYMKNSNIN